MGQVQPKSWDQVRPGVLQGLAPTNGLYSAWNWEKGLYDYYEAPEKDRPSYGAEIQPPPAQNALGSALGEDPDRSSHGMPHSAKYVGTGSVALGEIVAVVQSANGIAPWVGVALALAVPTAILWFTVKLGDIFSTSER